MKVRCKANNLRNIKDASLLCYLRKYIHLDDDAEQYLTVGKIYNVYGIVFRECCPWYYIFEDDSDMYPKPKSANFFEVVDDCLPACWILEHRRDIEGKCHSSLVFKEWADNELFYEKLIDENPLEVEIFKKYKKLIDNES